ncbi:hypothetical protein ACVWXM_008868 [Bradyrhizobium sp. GM7.3]
MIEIAHHRVHEATALALALDCGNAGLIVSGAQAHHFGGDLDPAQRQRLGALEQRDMFGSVAHAALEVGECGCDTGVHRLEFFAEARVAIDLVATCGALGTAHQHAQVGDLLQHPDGVIDPGRIGP